MRVVSGYYHMSAWRYRTRTHSVVVIASEPQDAAEALEMFFRDRGYNDKAAEIVRGLKKVRNISSNATVIVAVTDIIITKV